MSNGALQYRNRNVNMAYWPNFVNRLYSGKLKYVLVIDNFGP